VTFAAICADVSKLHKVHNNSNSERCSVVNQRRKLQSNVKHYRAHWLETSSTQ